MQSVPVTVFPVWIDHWRNNLPEYKSQNRLEKDQLYWTLFHTHIQKLKKLFSMMHCICMYKNWVSLFQMFTQKLFRLRWSDTVRERWLCCCHPSGGRSSVKPPWTHTHLQVCVCACVCACESQWVSVCVCETVLSLCVSADSSSGSDAEGSLGRAGGVSVDSWISRALHGSPSTSSSSSSHSNSSANAARLAETSMHPYGSKNACIYSHGSK